MVIKDLNTFLKKNQKETMKIEKKSKISFQKRRERLEKL